MAEERIKFVQTTKMADRRKQIEQIYSGSDEGLRRIFDRASGVSAGARYNEAQINNLINRVGTENINRQEILNLTNFAYATDPNYANIIDYLSNMFLWRYYYFPVEKKEGSGEYGEMYDLMTEVVDGLSIEVTFPTILTKLVKEGSVYLYATRNTSAKTISTIVLNPAYCSPIMMSQYGTGIFQFDTKYFDDLGFRGEELEEVLELFPSELTDAYREYKNGGLQKVVLDGRYSTYLSMNDFGFANKLSVLKSLFDYNQYRANEVERSGAQLDRVMTHKIPSHEGRLLFELPEVNSLHKSMTRSLGQSKRTKLITTFGNVEILPLVGENKLSAEMLEKGQQNIYRAAGINAELFSGKTRESLETSLTKDQSVMWRYVQQLVNFYNLTSNNLFNFKGFQLEITMLPITHYNLRDTMELYRRNAEYGIGRLESVVASGTKQKHIGPKSRLEEHLKLDEVLKPLASSHTQSQKEEPKTKETVGKEEVKGKEEKGDDENEQE